MSTAPTPPAAAPAAKAAPTPENTPIPGPGTWRWSPARGGWVPNTPQPDAEPAPNDPATE